MPLNSKEECCKEIEAHLRQLLDSEEHQDQPTRLIRRVRVLQGNGLSTTVQFNHIARRNAIRAKELLDTIEKKNKKFSHKKPNYFFISPKFAFSLKLNFLIFP